MSFFIRKKPIGLDLGRDSLKAVRLSPWGRGVNIERFTSITLPPGARLQDGLLDGGVLTPLLKEIAARDRIGGRLASQRVYSLISGEDAVVKTIELPRMSDAELRQAMEWEYRKHIPIPREEAVFSFTVMEDEIRGGTGDKSGEESVRILLVAARTGLVQALAAVLRGAGLSPTAFEVDSLANFRALKRLGFVSGEGASVLLDWGLHSTRMTVFAGGAPVVSHVIRSGGSDITAAVARGMEEGEETAELKKRVYGCMAADTREFIMPVLSCIFGEIAGRVQTFLALNEEATLGQIFLVGGGALLKGLAPSLEEFIREAVDESRLEKPLPAETPEQEPQEQEEPGPEQEPQGQGEPGPEPAPEAKDGPKPTKRARGGDRRPLVVVPDLRKKLRFRTADDAEKFDVRYCASLGLALRGD